MRVSGEASSWKAMIQHIHYPDHCSTSMQTETPISQNLLRLHSLGQLVTSLPQHVERDSYAPCVDACSEVTRGLALHRHVQCTVQQPSCDIFSRTEVQFLDIEFGVVSGDLLRQTIRIAVILSENGTYHGSSEQRESLECIQMHASCSHELRPGVAIEF